MKFLVDLEPVYAEAYKLMAADMGYGSRQSMVEYILRTTMNQYPNYLYQARPGVAMKMAVDHHEEEFVPILTKPTEEDLEYWQKELDSIPESSAETVNKNAKNIPEANVPHETPELPEL